MSHPLLVGRVVVSADAVGAVAVGDLACGDMRNDHGQGVSVNVSVAVTTACLMTT